MTARVHANMSAASAGSTAVDTRVITFGTFDIFHVGHLSILERARAFGTHLTVGVSTDALNEAKKGRPSIYGYAERARIIASLRCVDAVFAEESLEQKREYVRAHRADVLVMGDDWAGRFDDLRDACRVVYLSRTPSVSTTATIERIKLA
jgi:choline-phosphate cytidylyltransferase